MKHACLLLPLVLLAACQRDPEPEPLPPSVDATAAAATDAAAPASVPPPAITPLAESAPVQEGIPRKIAMPPETTPTPPLPPSTEVSYVCENGMSLRIAYSEAAARIAWIDGRELTLSRSAGEGAGETYTGDGYVLQRRGNVAQVNQQGGTFSARCEESTSSA